MNSLVKVVAQHYAQLDTAVYLLIPPQHIQIQTKMDLRRFRYHSLQTVISVYFTGGRDVGRPKIALVVVKTTGLFRSTSRIF